MGVDPAKTLAQALSMPIVGITSLDALGVHLGTAPRRIAAVIDAAAEARCSLRRYRAGARGLVRETDYLVLKPDHLVAELQAVPEEVLCLGNGGHPVPARDR